MAIISEVTPSDRAAFSLRAGSPLNPRVTRAKAGARYLNATAAAVLNVANSGAATINTRRHLANLERLLEKQAPAPPLPPPAETVASPGKDPDMDSKFDPRDHGGLVNVLNLTSSLLPWYRSHEDPDMSPRSLTHLQRLLSDNCRPSPRATIARKWRQYHGANDWAGLLDPLDEHLRRELVHYGDFVHDAYQAFNSNPAARPGSSRAIFLPDRSYRVTSSLFATSSVELPPWVDRLVDQSVKQRSSWIGYVAVCDNEPEIHRMGRRDIVIALRGTSTCLEWVENFRTGLVPVDDDDGDDTVEQGSHVQKVECGFRSLYKTAAGPSRSSSLSAAIVDEVQRLVEQYEGEEVSVTVTGHSLGAALAVLAADELRGRLPERVPVAVFSFGGPRVGNRAFADRVEQRGVKVLRVVNAHDMVTRVPTGYWHVGEELVVDHRWSPYLRADAGPACCHDLEAYLHLVDGFMGSKCPFRADAKRSLARLLNYQAANVKKLYLQKIRSLQEEEEEANPPRPPSVAASSQVQDSSSIVLARPSPPPPSY